MRYPILFNGNKKPAMVAGFLLSLAAITGSNISGP